MSDLDNGAAETVTEQTDSRQSLEEQMGQVWDRMEKAETEEAEAERAVTAEPEESGQEETQQADERPRSPDGKFIAKDAKPDEAEAAEADEATDRSAEESKTEGTEEPPSTLEAPTSWSAAAKAEWAKLPSAIQQEVLKREADIAKGFEDRANRLKTYEPIERALEPIRQQLDLNGVSPGQYVRQLVAAEQYLRQNPAEAIQYLAQSYGVDLQGLNQQQADQPPVDPTVAALQQQVRTIQQGHEQFIQQQQAQQQEAVERQIEAFKADPKHKHFDAVESEMAALAALDRQAGKQPELEDLYQRAIWANPAIREQLLAEQKVEAEKKAAEERAKRRKEVERAAASNIGTQGTGAGETPRNESLEEQMARTYDRIVGAA